eukprot:scaffold424_cov165-Ochromonas_danica.AAC.27
MKRPQNFLRLIMIVGLLMANSCFAHQYSLVAKQKTRTSYVRKGRAVPHASHEVVVAVNKKNMESLKALAIERATPGNPLYQQWLSVSEVDDLVVNEEASQRVQAWLKSHEGVSVTWVSRRGDYIKAHAPISTWEEVLQTEFHDFHDRRTGKTSVRALEYSLPDHLHEDIATIFNTVQAPPVIKKKYHSPTGEFKTQLSVRRLRGDEISTAAASGGVTVSFLNSYYKISSNIGSASINQSVFETNNEDFSPADLEKFQKENNLTVQSAISIGNHSTWPANCLSNSVDCYEGNLDIQFIMGVAQKTSSIYWWVNGNTTTDPFVAWLIDVADEAHPSLSNSMSWGSDEPSTDNSVLKQFDDEAAILAALGVTVTVSSGDDGAIDKDPNNEVCLCAGKEGSNGYVPDYPATSPWVTAVGATMGPEQGKAEIACQASLNGVITSGGGFSNYYGVPNWQKKAISQYFSQLNSSTKPAPGYGSGRGYPDIALLGANYQVVVNGSFVGLYGTSCSSPVMAAFVSLVNAARKAQNLSSIGFLNPTLYSVGINNFEGLGNKYGASFTDVTSGSNFCCSMNNDGTVPCCDTGFHTAKGWDPVTGWGSISFEDFSAIFMVATPYTPSDDDDSSSSKLSGGAIAGIVIGSVVGAIAVAGVIYILLMKTVFATSEPEPQPIPVTIPPDERPTK